MIVMATVHDLATLRVADTDLEIRRPLRVGIIAPAWVPVPPPVYGGTELVLDELARGLVRAGCEVSLFTTGDATCPVDRHWHYPSALTTVADPEMEVAHVAAAYRAFDDVDVIHDHTVQGPLWAIDHHVRTPIVSTMHGELTPEFRAHYATLAAAGVHVVAISASQRSTAAPGTVTAVIHHGIDTTRFPFGSGDGGYVMFLGRMHPSKGAHRAIAVARMAGVPILLAAKIWEPEEHRYFTRVVEPLLGPDATYLGEVGGAEKLERLAGARALLNPIRWPEPFGLVMIESLACGTPVLTFAEGAAPEIVEHGRCGFICRDEAEMVAALGHVDELDRAACRDHVDLHFSRARMVADHLALYQRVLRPSTPTRAEPTLS